MTGRLLHFGNFLFDIGIQAHSRGGAEDAEPSVSEFIVTNTSAAKHPQPFRMACEPEFPETQCLPENKKAAHDGRPVIGKFDSDLD